MPSERSSLYMTGSRTLKILKDPSLVKSDLLLGLVIRINIIFILGILCRRYTLFLFLRVGPQTLFIFMNFFITLLTNTKFYYSFFITCGFLPLILLYVELIPYTFLFLLKLRP